jgi:uncharacterized phage protein gp47/JayE
MPRFTIKRYEQILTQMISKVVTRSELSDISNSSAWKHVLSAAARQDDEQYYQMLLLLQLFSIDTATGEDLDARAAEIQPATISRNLAVKSSGVIVISRSGTTGNITIPIGTKVKTTDGIVVSTTEVGTITPVSAEQIPGHGTGRDSNLIACVADVAGTSGNVAAHTLVKFVSKPPGVNEVTNVSAFTSGLSKEGDDAFRNRIRAYISSLARSTIEALEQAVLGTIDPNTGATIRFANAVEDPINRGYVTLYIDDGAGTAATYEAVTDENVTYGLAGPPANSAVGGEEVLYLDYRPVNDAVAFTLVSSVNGTLERDVDFYLNTASGQINFVVPLVAAEVITATYTRYTGLIEIGQKVIDGDAADRTNYPGYRAAGVLVWVKPPTVLIQNIAVSLSVREGYTLTAVQAAAKQAIIDYINSLNISEDILISGIITAVKLVAGVQDVIMENPTSNVPILDDQLARTTDSNVSAN